LSFRGGFLLAGLAGVLVGCGGPAPDQHGRELYQRTCSACHGIDAAGMPHLGKSLLGNELVASHGREELVAFLRVGRRAWDPLNSTGVDMPPRGGNPALTDEDLGAIADFLKTLPAP
jgi:mono/diheme cytochrome c family protein